MISGNDINLTVDKSPKTILESSPVQQYVTGKNKTAVVGEKVELYCIYSGKYVILISTQAIRYDNI